MGGRATKNKVHSNREDPNKLVESAAGGPKTADPAVAPSPADAAGPSQQEWLRPSLQQGSAKGMNRKRSNTTGNLQLSFSFSSNYKALTNAEGQKQGQKSVGSIVAGLFAHGTGAAVLAFGLFLLPSTAFLWSRVDSLDVDTGGRHQRHMWFFWGSCAVTALILTPMTFSCLVEALYGGATLPGASVVPTRTGEADEAKKVDSDATTTDKWKAWRPPQAPGWKAYFGWAGGFAVPHWLGVAGYLAMVLPPVQAATGYAPWVRLASTATFFTGYFIAVRPVKISPNTVSH